MKKFLYNHDYNFIKSLANNIVDSLKYNEDRKVISTFKEITLEKITEKMDFTVEQYNIVKSINNINSQKECKEYLDKIYSYTFNFSPIEKYDFNNLFKKIKKLNIPDKNTFSEIPLTYMGWNDLGSKNKYLIYKMNEDFVGIQLDITLPTRIGYCTFCNTYGSVTLSTAKVKTNKQKSISHYLCLDSMSCNKNINSTVNIENFIRKLEYR